MSEYKNIIFAIVLITSVDELTNNFLNNFRYFKNILSFARIDLIKRIRKIAPIGKRNIVESTKAKEGFSV
jgi:hypothetical protein